MQFFNPGIQQKTRHTLGAYQAIGTVQHKKFMNAQRQTLKAFYISIETMDFARWVYVIFLIKAKVQDSDDPTGNGKVGLLILENIQTAEAVCSFGF